MLCYITGLPFPMCLEEIDLLLHSSLTCQKKKRPSLEPDQQNFSTQDDQFCFVVNLDNLIYVNLTSFQNERISSKWDISSSSKIELEILKIRQIKIEIRYCNYFFAHLSSKYRTSLIKIYGFILDMIL